MGKQSFPEKCRRLKGLSTKAWQCKKAMLVPDKISKRIITIKIPLQIEEHLDVNVWLLPLNT